MPTRAIAVLLTLATLPAQSLVEPNAISEYVRRVFEDRAGHLWMGMNGDGVARYDGKELTWFDAKVGFAGSALRGIAQHADGAMWFAHDAGVSRWQRGAFQNFTTANGLAADGCWSLFCDRDGTIWAGTVNGLCRLVGDRFELFALPKAVETPESRFDPRVVWRTCQDRDGNLWFATDGNGLHRYDGKAITSFTTKDGLPGDGLRTVFADREGKIWCGGDGCGLARRDGETWRRFTQKDGLANDRVFELEQDAAGHLWISTLGAGLCRWDGTRFTAFGASEGLTRSHVQSILPAKDGRLWIGCSGGLFRREGERFVHVSRTGPWR